MWLYTILSPNTGVHHLLRDHLTLLQEATVNFNPVACAKHTGQSGCDGSPEGIRLAIVRAGGHIEAWQPLYKYVINAHYFISDM